MSWQLLVSLSVVLYSVDGLLNRTIMKDDSSDAYAQAVVFSGSSALFFLIVLLFRGGFQSTLTWNQIMLLVLFSLLQSGGLVFTFKGFKSIGASEHSVLLTSALLWKMLGAILVLRESLTILKLAGIVAILFGIVFAQWKKQTFKLNRGAAFVLLAAFCFGTSGTVEYFIVRSFDVVSYIFYACTFITSILLIIKPQTVKKFAFYCGPKRALNVVTVVINEGLATILGLMAYQIGRNALQIGPISATQTIVTVVLGIIILKERDNAFHKIIGGLAAAAGAIILLL